MPVTLNQFTSFLLSGLGEGLLPELHSGRAVQLWNQVWDVKPECKHIRFTALRRLQANAGVVFRTFSMSVLVRSTDGGYDGVPTPPAYSHNRST